MKIPMIAPSVLASDFANIQKEVEMLNQSEADWIHVDVMDGRFVPNISFGIPVTEAIRRHAHKPLDVHLMIEEPERYVEDFFEAGAAVITVHYEACRHLHRNIQQIKALDCKAGVALNPHTPVALLEDIIGDLDLVLIMSVNPGFGGQTFIPNTLKKIEQMREIIVDANATALIEVDGGVNLENARDLIEAGADVLVAGSFVFKSENPMETIWSLKSV
ncbi:ribulose-phosphate 3-epimerase [Fulvivirga sedimenti]|uniref:Ribulose-phosphate 3-epimerase n=1 Tax=Fulvivirga sedimenti TaxID=2879465 RepID=A0A9X1HWF1_9BACT|nr:ribulose-phosphate 3-epimerase [Fulvivirga sedimenti]MCA6078896.1 ribulose-phosphate 3-epimerase [Fulvivirga sedimenti]